jgi:hypothetical protein
VYISYITKWAVPRKLTTRVSIFQRRLAELLGTIVPVGGEAIAIVLDCYSVSDVCPEDAQFLFDDVLELRLARNVYILESPSLFESHWMRFVNQIGTNVASRRWISRSVKDVLAFASVRSDPYADMGLDGSDANDSDKENVAPDAKRRKLDASGTNRSEP